MKKEYYIDLMEKTLSAYDLEHIDRYYNEVKNNGLKEHGFPRLTANIGILMARGRRLDLKDRFIAMMDTCCEQIPQVKAANDFSVKEIIFCLQELDGTDVICSEKMQQWKDQLRTIDPYKCYDKYVTSKDGIEHNWAAFTMLSEYMRQIYGLANGYADFIDLQAHSQLRFLDENKMYRDPAEPMVYDLVTRGLFALLLDQGYKGEYKQIWADALDISAMPTLNFQSVSGEIMYGGRSNQFIHNEAHLAIMLEYYAKLFARKGDMATASKFKAQVKRALENISSWLAHDPITHVKNYFPYSAGLQNSYGCEFYAYFDKYMITAASFLYAAYRICDENIPCAELDDKTGMSWQSSEHFHKLVLRAGEYFAEYDYNADYHYDCSGLGRLHRKGAPSEICMSTPCSNKPLYYIEVEEGFALAIAPGICINGNWQYGAEKEVRHIVKSHGASGETAEAEVECIFSNDSTVKCHYKLDRNGLQIKMQGQGAVRCLLPAFKFNGKEYTEISQTDNTLEITYKGFTCRYTVQSGTVLDLKQTARNRNGYYDCYAAEGNDSIQINVAVNPSAS